MFQQLGDDVKRRALQRTGHEGDSQAYPSSRREHSRRRKWPTLVSAAGSSGKMRAEAQPLDFTVWRSLVSSRQPQGGTEEKASWRVQGEGGQRG